MMGFFSALNPLTYGRKQAVAWNALMGAYTFARLNESDIARVLGAADEVARRAFRRAYNDVVEKDNRLVAYNFLVYGMCALGIRPACGNTPWFHVDNPFVASIGAEELIGFTKRQLEEEHGVKFPDIE